jgi:aminodeoxyfutalosine synthase
LTAAISPPAGNRFAKSASSANRILVNFFVQRSDLRDLYDKVAAGERITEADALRLFESKDLNAIGAIADLARQKKVGNRASYIVNRYLNYSNYCILSCQFCSFARKKRDADGFELSIPQMVEKAREALKLGITELHIVGGLHPSLPFSYYTDMLKALNALNQCSAAVSAASSGSVSLPPGSAGVSPASSEPRHRHGDGPRMHLKCFTAIEILHLAWLAKKSVEQTLRELKDAGLDSLTGGGAEIFRKEVRSAIARGKESAEEYLDVHRTWHRMGCRSTCTMLYGHVESLADRVDHLRQLRALQDETHGFVGFIPLAYHPQDNDIPVEHAPTGFDSLRTIAISRIYLDNFDHITAYWVGLSMKLAQVALSYGADDVHGTIIEEHIFHMAGATSPQLQTEADMIKAIREAGRTPVQRDTFYQPIKVLAGGPQTNGNDAESFAGKSKVLQGNLATG